MISIEGVVRFFIWTEAAFKNIIEAQLYAQYPTVEIYEASDYTEGIFLIKTKYRLWERISRLPSPTLIR